MHSALICSCLRAFADNVPSAPVNILAISLAWSTFSLLHKVSLDSPGQNYNHFLLCPYSVSIN